MSRSRSPLKQVPEKSGGTKANESGSALEMAVCSLLHVHGFKPIPYESLRQGLRNGVLAPGLYYVRNAPFLSAETNTEKYLDFLLVRVLRNSFELVGVECKSQHSSGSVAEKYRLAADNLLQTTHNPHYVSGILSSEWGRAAADPSVTHSASLHELDWEKTFGVPTTHAVLFSDFSSEAVPDAHLESMYERLFNGWGRGEFVPHKRSGLFNGIDSIDGFLSRFASRGYAGAFPRSAPSQCGVTPHMLGVVRTGKYAGYCSEAANQPFSAQRRPKSEKALAQLSKVERCKQEYIRARDAARRKRGG